METDQRALLNAIIAKPDDDAPRLIYADWLDENGQAERATIIRAQVKLARLPISSRKCNSRKVRGLRSKAQVEILTALVTIKPEIPEFIQSGLKRGFAHEVSCEASEWETHGDQVTDDYLVQEVKLTTNPSIAANHLGSSDTVDFYTVKVHGGVLTAKSYSDACNLWASRWPKVRFEFQPVPFTSLVALRLSSAYLSREDIRNHWGFTSSPQDEIAARVSHRMFDRMIQEMGIPPHATFDASGVSTTTRE